MKFDNIRLTSNDETTARQRMKDAESRKKSMSEPIEDAWERIFASKLTDTDRSRLIDVKNALESGIIGRELTEKPKRFSKAEAMRIHKELQEVQREGKIAELIAKTPSTYHLITDYAELRDVVSRAGKEKVIAVDTETTGLDVYTDVIVGVSITIPSEDYHCYIPITPTADERALDSEKALSIIEPLIVNERVGKVYHNALYDIAMFERHNIYAKGLVWDTQTAMHVLNENEPSYRLKDLVTKYLGEPSDTFTELFGKDVKFAEVPLDAALVYAAKDTDLTWRLFRFQLSHLRKLPSVLKYYQEVEVPLLTAIYHIERNGYVLDLEFAKEYGEELSKKSDKLHKHILETLGDPELNLNAPQQVRPILSAYIGEEIQSMDAKKSLKPLAKKHKIVADILEYKKLTKLSSTYIDKLPLKINKSTGRLHSRFNPAGTVTGRFSSGKDEHNSEDQSFNVQNQPQESRKLFVAPKGKVIVGADFKAQEIRCVAYLSGEPALIEAFEQNKDPYASLAVRFTGLPYEEVNKNPDGSDTEWRKKMKVAWLAALYGASGFTLGEWLGVSKEEATTFMDELWSSLPKLGAWLEGNKQFAAKNGFVWMDKEQRKRRLPDATRSYKHIPFGKYNDPEYAEAKKSNGALGGALRQATNARVQGSSAIQMKKTMIEAHKVCEQRPGWAVWGTVHDELLFEIPEDFTRKDIDVIERVMLDSYLFGDVANGTDIEIMRVWGEGVSVDKWFEQGGIRTTN